MSAYFAESWPIWISAFCVLAIYSYLVKDNPVYRTMMQVFIGANLGYQAVVQWRDVLYPQWWLPMVDGFRAWFGGPGSPWGAAWALVGALGLLFYFQLSRKYFWLSRIVIGITIGIGAGLTFKSQFGQNLPQVVDSFKPLAPAVIAPKPRTLLKLPGSDFPPVVRESVAYFVSGSRVTAVETLGGVELWRAELGQPVVETPRLEDEGLMVRFFEGTARLDPATGAISEVPSFRAGDSGEPGSIYSSDGKEYIHADGSLTVRDVATRATLGSLVMPENITGAVLARFNQPQFDGAVLVVGIYPDEVRAYAFRDGVAANIRKGDLLWSAHFHDVGSLQAMPGVLLVQGVSESPLWEIPIPTAKLQTRDYFDNWVFVITMVSVMTYFFFSFRWEGRAAKATSQLGRWLLMIGFGAFFGNTVMTRMSYLLDRLMFLIDDWLRPFWHQLF